MSEHTKGPWDVSGLEFITNSKGCTLAHVWSDDLDHDGDVEAEAEANARLIAAAPELLEACKQLTAFAKRQGWFHVAIEAGEAAIAKAEGRQS